MGQPEKFRKKPVVIEAMQLPPVDPDEPTPDALLAVVQWVNRLADAVRGTPCRFIGAGAVLIETLEGDMRADPGDYVIRGVKGEFYPCKPAIFAATYEPVG